MKQIVKLYESYFNDPESLQEIINKNCRDYELFFDAKEIEFVEGYDEDKKKEILIFLKKVTEFVGKELSEDGTRERLNDFLKERFVIDKDDWSSIFIKNCIFEYFEDFLPEEDLKTFKKITNLPHKFNLQSYKIEEDTEEDTEEDAEEDTELNPVRPEILNKLEPGNLMLWSVDIDENSYLHYCIYLYHQGEKFFVIDPCTTTKNQIPGHFITIYKTSHIRKNCTFVGFFDVFKNFENVEDEETY